MSTTSTTATKNTKNKKQATSKNSAPKKNKLPVFSERNIRLSFGLLFLLLGSFLSLSIISYFFTWQKDQDFLINSMGVWKFLMEDQSVVENSGGRLGAAASHIFVFKGIGIVSLLVSFYIAILGLNLVNGKQVFSLTKWPKWIIFSILFFSPFLSFLFAKSDFPMGGYWGKSLIEWTDGFAGIVGNIAMMVIVLLFFLTVVFRIDFRPWVSQAKEAVLTKDQELELQKDAIAAEDSTDDSSTFKGYRHFTEKEEAERNEKEAVEQNEIAEKGKGNTLKESSDAEMIIVSEKESEKGYSDELELTLVQKESTDPYFENPTTTQDGRKLIHLELPEKEDVGSSNSTESEDADDLGFEVTTIEDEVSLTDAQSHQSIESTEPYDPSLELSNFKFPTLDLLEGAATPPLAVDKEELSKAKDQIVNTLRSFGIEIQKIFATVGPTVTLYEIVPAEGVRISKIRNLEDDIALNLSALGIRIIAPIPGRGTIGIEVPNTNKQIVHIRTLLASDKFVNTKMVLPIALGKKIDNENYVVDLATMPHLLMAGATGQGKSVGINAILVSLLYKKHPSQLKFVLIDPKKVELSIYRVIEKHYLAMLPNEEEAIITDTTKVINTLNALGIEMDNRYELLKEARVRNIKEYNEKFINRQLNPLKGHKYLPFIVLVIDEFADLIMTAGKEVEQPIARLAQLARAIGIHIVIATQRPSVNVITGIIKANFPARIAFKVSAKVDSRTILDTGGAEQLIGRGDMLVSHGSELLRLQCAFVDTPEVERIVNFIGDQQGYPTAFELPEYEGAETSGPKDEVDLTKRDALFEDCARIVVSSQSGSTSMLQRRLNLGYNRAGRIMDQLEAAGIVGPQEGSKPRDVYVSTEYELENILRDL